MYNVALKAAITPALIGGASLAGRRWGHHVGGWLVALPLTSGPVAWFLGTDHGTGFAATATVGMLAGTISQVGFALAYQWAARGGWGIAFAAGCTAFAAATLLLTQLHASAILMFALVIAAIVGGYLATPDPAPAANAETAIEAPPRWEIPVRMAIATAVVIAITALAPVIGAHLAGLLSPFPVFGAVVAIFTHHSHGPAAAAAALAGLIMGLAAPAVFFLALALALPHLGLAAFAVAAPAALATQAATLFAIPSAER